MSASLLQFMTWLSPAFPVGGFAWSSGLESACNLGLIHTRADVENWLATSLWQGSLHTDTVLLAATVQLPEHATDINELGLALAGSAERFSETTALGSAFIAAVRPWRSSSPVPAPDLVIYPVAVGLLASENGLHAADAIAAYLQSAVSHQLQAALRLLPLGQTAATEIQRGMEATIIEKAAAVVGGSLDQLGTSTIAVEIAAMKHETQNSRIFRS